MGLLVWFGLAGVRGKTSTKGNSYLFRFNEFEFHSPACPSNEVGVAWVIQQSHQELPELQRPPPLIRRALTVSSPLVLDVPCQAYQIQ